MYAHKAGLLDIADRYAIITLTHTNHLCYMNVCQVHFFLLNRYQDGAEVVIATLMDELIVSGTVWPLPGI